MAGSAAAALRGPVRGPHPGGPELPWRPGSSRRRLGTGAGASPRPSSRIGSSSDQPDGLAGDRTPAFGGDSDEAAPLLPPWPASAAWTTRLLSLLPTKQRTQPAEKDAARAPSPRKRPFPRRRRAAAVPSFWRSLHRTCLRLPTQKRRRPSPRRFRGRRVTSRHRGITSARRPSGCRTAQKPHKSSWAVAPRQISMGPRATPHRNL